LYNPPHIFIHVLDLRFISILNNTPHQSKFLIRRPRCYFRFGSNSNV